jgi:CRP/FNR family transcriptional regulator, cyclic AMP receptor protein
MSGGCPDDFRITIACQLSGPLRVRATGLTPGFASGPTRVVRARDHVTMSEETARAVEDLGSRGFGSRGVRLLDADPDLAADLSPEHLAQARNIVLPTITLDPGPWHIAELRDVDGVQPQVRGFLALDGAIAMDLTIATQVCTRLVTPGELVLLDGFQDDSIPMRSGWTVIEHSRLAILDQRLLLIGARWPGLLGAILNRAAQQVHHALLQQAISQLPRVEDRLLALMWSIADRRGVVRGDAVWVHLPVTHATLAQMIGARRPTVSLGLRTLAERGVLEARDGGWLIARDSVAGFPLLGARPAPVRPRFDDAG